MKALFSLSDRSGIEDFAKAVKEAGYEIISTGGTGRSLAKKGLEVTEVSTLTGFPEILDGRVKTLHPKIHGGILARRDLQSHKTELTKHSIDTIDLVAVNLYPFVETVMRQGVTLDDALEQIDIGGPTLIRAAAKNFRSVIVVVDPEDYDWIGKRLTRQDTITIEERQELAQKAFQHVALYDTAVSQYLQPRDTKLPKAITFGYEKIGSLKYGENPHQAGALYSDPMSIGGIVRAKQLSGPDISFNNILDGEAAWRIVSDFKEPAATVVKHNNPCGLAVDDDQPTAYIKAYEGDSMSAYGGIVAFNRTLTAATAKAMKGVLYHVVIAPSFDPEALNILAKRKQARVLQSKVSTSPTEFLDIRKVTGGAMIQMVDDVPIDTSGWTTKSKRQPTASELQDLVFAWKAAKHIKSNSIVLAKDNALVGMGAGQPNRVTSVHLALRISGEKSKGSVLASDAFFPFSDGIELAASGGITAVVEPGGSMRDNEVIEAADKLGLALVFTGMRHFRH